MKEMQKDVWITDLGTLWSFELLTPRAVEWWEEKVSSPAYMGTNADWRQAREIVLGMCEDGLAVDTSETSPLAWGGIR